MNKSSIVQGGLTAQNHCHAVLTIKIVPARQNSPQPKPSGPDVLVVGVVMLVRGYSMNCSDPWASSNRYVIPHFIEGDMFLWRLATSVPGG